jgi:hypothetical protein
VSTLDILLGQRFQGKQLFIKMDIEGGEFAALKGAVNTIKRTPGPIFLVEICLTEHHPNGINNNYKDIFDIFWSNKYEVRAANKHGVLVNPSDIEKWVKSKYCELSTNNYIFIPMG